ncbi:hypothetical protein D0T87_03305 [Bacteroides sp. 51]|nr:hypothetical protein [Bacteroides sp. 51]
MLVSFLFIRKFGKIDIKNIDMSKNKKVKHSKKEEQQAQKVVKIIFVSLIILGLAMIIGFSFFS